MKWQETLELKHSLEKEVKRRGMIFQYESKVYFAQFWNIPIKQIETISFDAWGKVTKLFNSFKEEAEENNDNLKTTFGQVWTEYKTVNPNSFNKTRNLILQILDR